MAAGLFAPNPPKLNPEAAGAAGVLPVAALLLLFCCCPKPEKAPPVVPVADGCCCWEACPNSPPAGVVVLPVPLLLNEKVGGLLAALVLAAAGVLAAPNENLSDTCPQREYQDTASAAFTARIADAYVGLAAAAGVLLNEKAMASYGYTRARCSRVEQSREKHVRLDASYEPAICMACSGLSSDFLCTMPAI